MMITGEEALVVAEIAGRKGGWSFRPAFFMSNMWRSQKSGRGGLFSFVPGAPGSSQAPDLPGKTPV
ncbi:MAG TPA: hypothetical protein VN371_07110 [Chlorobaculum sp.]|nr:hypothetical protein [Chlorobaculum sp.]